MSEQRLEKGRFILALFLVTLTGYISLSYEILWVRLYSFVSGARAWAFGAMLRITYRAFPAVDLKLPLSGWLHIPLWKR